MVKTLGGPEIPEKFPFQHSGHSLPGLCKNAQSGLHTKPVKNAPGCSKNRSYRNKIVYLHRGGGNKALNLFLHKLGA